MERNDYTPDYLLIGGLIILGNPCHHDYINDPNFDQNIHKGFYDNANFNDANAFNIDDVAD